MAPYAGQPFQPPPSTRQLSRLVRPLPIWAFLGGIVLIAVLLIVLFITGSDWAAGAQTAGIVAGILALLLLGATGVRAALGLVSKTNPKRRSQLISASLVILLLVVISGIGLTQQSFFHRAQASNLEGQKQWASALSEFQAGGETAPGSDSLARVYTEWGEQLIEMQQFESSIAKFDTVLTTYGSATTEVSRAQVDKVNAYMNWGRQASQQHDYLSATSHYDQLLSLPYCNTNCQSQTMALDATAYYNLAEDHLGKQDYSAAVNAFDALTTRFGNSPEVQKAHNDFARALFQQGRQQLTTACTGAVSIYQRLSKQFSDTPDGQQAVHDLKAPQVVKGHFTSKIPGGGNVPYAALVKGLTPNMPDATFFAKLRGSPQVKVNADGTFQFSPQPQSSVLDLVWGVVDANGEVFTYRYHNDNTMAYVATVTPLCAFDFGDIGESFPPPA